MNDKVVISHKKKLPGSSTNSKNNALCLPSVEAKYFVEIIHVSCPAVSANAEDICSGRGCNGGEIQEENMVQKSDTSRAYHEQTNGISLEREEIHSLHIRKKQKLNLSDLGSEDLVSKFLNFESYLPQKTEDFTKATAKLRKYIEAASSLYIESREFQTLICRAYEYMTSTGLISYEHLNNIIKELKAHKTEEQSIVAQCNAIGGTALRNDTHCSAVGGALGITSRDEPKLHSASLNVSSSLQNRKVIREEKKEKLIRRLEEKLAVVKRKIQKLQSKELTLADLENDESYYIKEDRLKKKYLEIWNMLSNLKRSPSSSTTSREVEKKFRYVGTKYSDFNESIEDMVNERNIFPTYHDIYHLVKRFSKENQLNMPALQMRSMAEDVFMDVGVRLKQRREQEDQDTLMSFLMGLPDSGDPADQDTELKKRLNRNATCGAIKIQKVINHFAQLQSDLVVEPIESSDSEKDDRNERNICETSFDESFE